MDSSQGEEVTVEFRWTLATHAGQHVSEPLALIVTRALSPPSPSSLSSSGESPSNHSHLVGADICGGSHDVPQLPRSHVRLHASPGRWGAGRAQRLLAGHPGHAGLARTGPRHR